MDTKKTADFVNSMWDASIVPEISEYIRIPNKSPSFDPDWEKHGHMENAVQLLEAWSKQQRIEGVQIEIVRIEGRTPILFIDIPGASDDVVLLYGHYDKQPEFSGWDDDLDPWTPTIKDGKLYGRGGADDGYATFGSLTAIRALQEQGISHAHCVVIIEGCEESGSFDLPYYIDMLEDRIGSPSLVVCLDAECGNYDQLWCTTSLRGNLTGTLRADVLTEGVHSGSASGVVPSSFRILRKLLSRIEDEETGRVTLDALHVDIPQERIAQAKKAAQTLGDSAYEKYPWAVESPSPGESNDELLLNNTWRPTLSITGADGLPALVNAGNVQLPFNTLKLSFRLPPTCNADLAAAAVSEVLNADTPPLCKAEFEVESTMAGWDAPPVADWLEASMNKASEAFFGKPSMYMGTGGTIPFMGMLGEKFPKAQFLITGLLGPKSNAHGPNEFLHIETGKRLTSCVAQVLEDHFNR
ncbi:MAG: M20 family metallopeptidase [Gammaproteobacteria bacterium]|nr:M20 family metallopeptidase [Gammaproteobacteria bacterium]MDH3372281.1 M20 family metallopeptidase [Gammaproteobacteria bacterium]MDH3409118.1 M20 family metallopeptidase [Gammaproteobacteria bacterium]MDH3553623.1 M20 family metallopeptidase [Gammaproteobacteria bacterium]